MLSKKWICWWPRYPSVQQELGNHRIRANSRYEHPVKLPDKLVSEALRGQDHVLRIPPKQLRGKPRAQHHSRQQQIPVSGHPDVPRGQAWPHTDIPSTPGKLVCQDMVPRRPNTSLIWYYLGRLDQDSAHLHPGTGLLRRWVLLPSLVQELPHQEAGHDAHTALWTVSGCLHTTRVNQLPILAGIATPMLRIEAAVLALSRKATSDEDHLLHKTATEIPPHALLKSQRPFAEHAHQLLHSTPDDVSKWLWLKHRWTEEWQAADQSRLHRFVE